MLTRCSSVNTPTHVRQTSDATPTFVRLVKFCYLCKREKVRFHNHVRRSCAHMFNLNISIAL